MVLKRLFGRAPEAPPPPAPDPGGDLAATRTALGALVRRVNAAAGRLPIGAVPEIRDICDRLAELLTHAEELSRTGGEVDAYAMATVAATVTDYLPTSIDRYLALPDSFVETHRNDDGQTPDEELLEHFDLLDQGIEDLATAVYSGDAQRLAIQGRFLDTKFSKSDLTL